MIIKKASIGPLKWAINNSWNIRSEDMPVCVAEENGKFYAIIKSEDMEVSAGEENVCSSYLKKGILFPN